jgi:molybdate transport system substrate-binding protein
MFKIRFAGCALTILFLFCSLIARGGNAIEPKNREILVSAAISLKDAFNEIGAIFQNQTGVKVQFNFGASGLLQKQIEAGAPSDVFASAGAKQMDALQSQGLIDAKTRRDFAGNTLVLIVPARSRAKIHSFADLARSEVQKIAIGNPKTVPAGQYGQEVLKNLNLLDQLQPRFVPAENVRQILDYVERDEVDAGIAYASDAAVPHGTAAIAAYAPKGSHAPIQYPIALVKETSNRSAAQRFIDLALSARGQAILQKYGFSRSR